MMAPLCKANATIAGNQGLGTITDDDPEVAISIDDVTVTEGDAGTTDAVFAVSLDVPSGKTVTVDFATADDTATAGADYNAAMGSVTFNPGETSQPDGGDRDRLASDPSDSPLRTAVTLTEIGRLRSRA